MQDKREVLFKLLKQIKCPLSNQRTKDHWGEEAGTWEIGRGLHWTEHLAVQERINRKVSEDHQRDPFQFFIKFLSQKGMNTPLTRCLTLGCGAGDLERGLSKYNFSLRYDAFDIADKAIERAKEKATLEGISNIYYKVADINTISLSRNIYDVVFGVHAVHHLNNLEHIFSEVENALKPGCFFFLYEFIGPTKFQWTDKQLNIVNSLLQILPEKYRISKNNMAIKTHFKRPTLLEMNQVDPSEAIRSEDILKVLPHYFEIIEKKDIGGTILHLLLKDIAVNFDYKNPNDMRVLKMLFEIEDALLEIGEIPSDFTVIIAQKK
jgi:2-polyprenyl-3-methyl-5-hydroxy-6-metoxy-1,4-benzoquinol methylase